MKLKPNTRSAFFNPRALTAFALCIVGCLLALFSVGAVPLPFGKETVDSKTRSGAAKSASAGRKSNAAPSKKKVAARGGAAKTISGGASKSPGARAQTLPFSNTANRVTEQKNAAGQTVYSIAPSRFDISPSLAELAKISLPKPVE